MPRYFVDTSALVKRYRSETGTELIDQLFAETNNQFVISRLGVVETTSALAINVRTGQLQPADYIVARKRFLGDVARGTVGVARLLVGHFRSAERLVDRYASTRRFRTLDALQLSVALDLSAANRIDAFTSADEILCDIADAEGLSTLNVLKAN